jgi:diadenosine tetraphosphate (Ap4A) HIT family hydrolase
MFSLHPQLQHDCHILGQLPHCAVLLHRNAVVPWFILVPRTEQPELLELPDAIRNAVLDEAALVARFLKSQFPVTKLNVAAIGNMVPQLHLHVIGRSVGDACWPRPVWGNLPETQAYASEQVLQLEQALRQLAAQSGCELTPE